MDNNKKNILIKKTYMGSTIVEWIFIYLALVTTSLSYLYLFNERLPLINEIIICILLIVLVRKIYRKPHWRFKEIIVPFIYKNDDKYVD